MIKGFRQIASLTVLSRILGMLRDVAFAYFLGASGLMDGWAIAFKIPNLARRIFGEGAASSSFIPVYSEQLAKDPKQAGRLANTVVTVIFVILAAAVLVGEGLLLGYREFFCTLESTDRMFALTGIMLPYMILICVVAILAGVLHTHRHFAAPAAAPIVLNVFLIGSLCFTGWAMGIEPARQVFIVAVAVLLAGLVQILIQIPALRASGVSLRPGWAVRSEAFRKIMIMMGPMILGLTVTQINTLADDVIAKLLSGSVEKGEFFTWFGRVIKYPLWDGAVSQLYYSQRLYQFPLGVLGISLATAIFPVMSADAARGDFDSLRRTVSRGIRGAVFIALPATVGLLLVARPLVAVIFQRGEFKPVDTMLTVWPLYFYSLGLCGFFAQQILTRAFYSMQDSKMPARSAVLAVFVNVVLNLALVWSMGTGGLALSTATCSYLQVLILAIVLQRRFGDGLLGGFRSTLVKTVLATAVMGLIGVWQMHLMRNLGVSFWPNITRLAVVVPSAAAVYLLAAKILRIEMLSLITGGEKKR
jgi:putative peptidoglycan lipid II flippase